MSSLIVTDVSKRFGDVVAVDHVSFELDGQELLALVGPSGCGKSTLLRTIAGLFRSETGSIALDGVTLDDQTVVVAPERRRIGLVFQEHALFPHLSVAKNVGFGVRDSRARESTVTRMLDLIGMSDFGDRYPHELSGGERQRVALARALAPEPALVLLDEPFASLDPNLRVQVRDDVTRILRTTSTPAVFVTHDQSEAMAIGDRIAVMRAGSMVQVDTPERVFHAPIDRFVAGFMGEADFVDADTARNDLGLLAGLPYDQVLMIRPDDISLSLNPDGAAVVTRAEFRGMTWQYEVRLRNGTIVHAIRSHVDPLQTGERVDVDLAPGHRRVYLD